MAPLGQGLSGYKVLNELKINNFDIDQLIIN